MVAITPITVGRSIQDPDLEAGSVKVTIPGDPTTSSNTVNDTSIRKSIDTNVDHLVRVVPEHHHNNIDSDRIHAKDIVGLDSNEIVTLASGSTYNSNILNGKFFTILANQNFTLLNPTNGTEGDKIIYRIKQDATGSRIVTWGSMFRGSTGTPLPTLSTAANAVDYVGFFFNAIANTWDCMAVNKGFPS